MRLADALALLERALGEPAPARADFVRAAAGDDAALCGEVLGLLAAHEGSSGFLEPPAEAPAPVVLGPWRLLASIGSGGMGRVWLAERADGAYAQRVAVKVMAGLLGDPDALRRAAAERQFLAALAHPNITRILDGGATPEGQPWVAMEYVEGERIDRWCAAAGLGVEARVRLFLKVLDAVDAAHRALIVHRDLKPANVLVTAAGEPKLLDFGIAKSLDGGAGEHTRTGLAPLTPAYASPEQLLGKPPTTACDVWALGVMLHELLTGHLPHDIAGMPVADVLPRLRAAPTLRPGQRIDAARLGIPAAAMRAWAQALGGDLGRVLGQALAFEPERRYPSARAFADDLGRWLDHHPVQARHGGAAYRAAKFVRRHRLPVAAAAAALLALVAGLWVAAQQAREARSQAERAQAAARFLGEVIGWADPTESGGETTLRQAIDRAASQVGERFAGQPELEADVRLALGMGYSAQLALEPAQRELHRALALTPEGSAARARAEVATAALDWSYGRTDRAEARYRTAIATWEALGETGTPLGNALSDYSALLNELERYDESHATAQRALAHIAGDAEPRLLAACLANRAYAEDGLGRFDDAEQSYAASSAIFERLLPSTAYSLSVNLNNRAMLMRGMERIAESIPLFERAIEMRETALGADHGSLATLYANLASARLDTGDLPGARRDAAVAVPIAERRFAPDYLLLGHVYFAAARIEAAAGAAAEARRLAGLAQAVYERADRVDPERRRRVQALLDGLPGA